MIDHWLLYLDAYSAEIWPVHARYPCSRRHCFHSSAAQERFLWWAVRHFGSWFLSYPAIQLSVPTVSLITDAMSRSSISPKSGFGLSGFAIDGFATCKLLVGRSMLVWWNLGSVRLVLCKLETERIIIGLPHFGHSSGDTITYIISLQCAQSCHRMGGGTRWNSMARL